jgi:hypothetical protein
MERSVGVLLRDLKPTGRLRRQRQFGETLRRNSGSSFSCAHCRLRASHASAAVCSPHSRVNLCEIEGHDGRAGFVAHGQAQRLPPA